MAELGEAVEEVRPEVSRLAAKAATDAARWLEAYASPGGWHRIDLLQRSLEAWIAKMDDEPEAERAHGVVRRHHEDVLKKMAAGFSRAFAQSSWTVPGALHQTRIYPDVVETMGGRVAYFFVDAMRYEMGVDLAQQLQQSDEVTVRPAIAALPSITPLGMAGLLPGASSSYSVVEHKGRLAARIGDTVMPSLTERMKHLRAARPDAKDLDLGHLLQRSTKSLTQTLDGVPLLVVRSQSIDGLGEMDSGLLARHIMDTVVGNIARAVRKLAKLGFDAFVITADHGHQFSVRKGEDMQIDNPGGKKVESAPTVLGLATAARRSPDACASAGLSSVMTRIWSSFSPRASASSGPEGIWPSITAASACRNLWYPSLPCGCRHKKLPSTQGPPFNSLTFRRP